jgi:CO/xanthine dehydrogenase FAD-binding subunit
MDVLVPQTLEEALEAREARPDAVAVAGGTDVMVAVNAGVRPPALLDLTRLEELRRWHQADGHVFVGAGVTFARIVRELSGFPPLVEAARTIGSPQIRNRATLGGNVGTGSPAGDGVAVLAAYGADVLVASRRGERRVPWDTFLVGPKRTSLAADELILGVEWRAVDGPGTFVKVGTRKAMVIAVAGVCVQLDPRAHDVRVALGSVAPTVIRAPDADAFASAVIDWDDPERPLAPDAATDFGRLAAGDASPIDDLRGSAAYRRHAVAVLARRAFESTLAERWEGPC